MDVTRIRDSVARSWSESIVPLLHDYIRIPALSPAFDPDWAERGEIARAVELVADWCRQQRLEGSKVEVVELPGRTPLLLVDVPGEVDDTVVLYGHLDKQPEMVGWEEGLGPWTPVLRGDRLYGRGGADDGYAAFASLTAIRALRQQGGRHARCVVLIEASEESGSPDLPAHVDALAERIGSPSLVVCLDSGCGNYDQLWCTTSLRGMAIGTLRVEVLREGVHSGDAGGIVPCSFRVLRRLLDRVEDPDTGELRLDSFHAEIPDGCRRQAVAAGRALGETAFRRFPFVEGASPLHGDPTEHVLARTWRPSLAVTGADGLPPLASAGNVLRTHSAVKLSCRLPPTADARAASEELGRVLTAPPTFGARVRFEPETASPGWMAPELEPWLEASVQGASRAYFGRDACAMGEGGSIPFMGMLGERFPGARFLVTGVLGPGSNAHGPNEFLHLPTAERLTCCVAHVLRDHGDRAGS